MEAVGAQQHPSGEILSSLAVVLPRYGASLGGGAETLVRDLVIELSRRQLIPRIEVWTTCAKDHRTWANEEQPGESRDGNILVRRFTVDDRDLEIFINSEHAIQDGTGLSVEGQLDWLSQSVNSRGLYQHIAAHGQEFDCILFAPYLFATSFWGSLIYPERSVLVPCLHDEPYAYLDVFHALFRRVRGMLFNAPAEQALAAQVYGLDDLDQRGAVVGMGFKPVPAMNSNSATDLVVGGREIDTPFLLYSGRKEVGKNVDLLITAFEHFRERFPEIELSLYLIGAGDLHFRETLPEGVTDLGFVTEEEKRLLMASALALCQPSVNESFSIVLMECWQYNTPVIVHGACAVTSEHVRTSGGGLYFENPEEFALVVRTLVRDTELRKRMGKAGARYVAETYSWEAVLQRFEGAVRTLL